MSAATAKLSKAAFHSKAPVVTLTIAVDGKPIAVQAADARDFSSGKVGYYFNGKVNLPVDGQSVPLQLGCNLTAIKSDEWPA
jgi:hypothetical protein